MSESRRVAVPIALKNKESTSDVELAVGPFVVTLNDDDPSIGTHLEFDGLEYRIWNESLTKSFDDSYEIEVDHEESTMTFSSELYWSEVVLRPFTPDDVEWALPDIDPDSLSFEAAREEVLDRADGGM